MMNNFPNIQEILDEVSEVIGLEKQTLDERNNIVLGFDKDIIITLHYDETEDRLIILSDLGTAPRDVLDIIVPEMLHANFENYLYGGPVAFLDNETLSPGLVLHIAAGNLNAEKLIELIESFVNLSEAWILRMRSSMPVEARKGDCFPLALQFRIVQ